MFSKVLVKLTAIFLILQISATSATPTAQPEEAQKINDDIHERANGPYFPYQCNRYYSWKRRECVPSLGPLAWQDVCARTTFSQMRQVWSTVYDNKEGSCPPGTYCLDSYNANNERFVDCVSDKATGKRKLDQYDPQIGVSDQKRAANQLSNTQFEYSVTLDHDMTGAAVTAVLRSECRRPVDVHCCMLLCSCRGSIKFRS